MSQSSTFDKSLSALEAGDLAKVSGGLLAPDQDPGAFPPWVLPYIRPTLVLNPQVVLKTVAVR